MFTIVFLSFHSEKHIKRLVLDIDKKYPIIIIENSLNMKLKHELEEKYNNVKVIVPAKNIGISAGYNLGIKESKTNYVIINSADINFSKQCLEDLEECANKVKDFAVLSPTYDDESIYKNYEIWDSKKKNKNLLGEIFKKYKIKEVDFIDNNFIINKRNFQNSSLFDENIFMYYETMDFCKRASLAGKKIYVCEKVKFTHFGSQSIDSKFSHKLSLNRSWHYNWSKFYYFKKNFGYFFGLRKIFPNFLRSLKGLIISKILNKKPEFAFYRKELSGIISSIFNKPSNYRPFENE